MKVNQGVSKVWELRRKRGSKFNDFYQYLSNISRVKAPLDQCDSRFRNTKYANGQTPLPNQGREKFTGTYAGHSKNLSTSKESFPHSFFHKKSLPFHFLRQIKFLLLHLHLVKKSLQALCFIRMLIQWALICGSKLGSI